MLLIFLMACKEDKKVEKVYSEDAEINELSAKIDQSPKDYSLWFERAKAYAKKEAYTSAVSDLNMAIQIDSSQAEAYHLLSDCYMDNYKSRLALETMLDASKAFPTRVPTLLKLSETQYILNQYDNSIRTINNILYLDQQNAEAYFMLGMNFRAIGDIPKAKNSFQTATEFDSGLLDAWILLGNIYEAEKDPKAKDYYEAAARINPDSPQAKHSLAYYLQNNGDVLGAIALYREINIKNREYADAYLNPGILYIEMDSLDKAYEQFNLLVENVPVDYRGFMYRGLVSKLKGNMEAGDADIQSVSNLTNQDEKVAAEVIKWHELLGLPTK
jgi:tetratricopeptide (TPR) repeat protein